MNITQNVSWFPFDFCNSRMKLFCITYGTPIIDHAKKGLAYFISKRLKVQTNLFFEIWKSPLVNEIYATVGCL
jgi:hypothetical protein